MPDCRRAIQGPRLFSPLQNDLQWKEKPFPCPQVNSNMSFLLDPGRKHPAQQPHTNRGRPSLLNSSLPAKLGQVLKSSLLIPTKSLSKTNAHAQTYTHTNKNTHDLGAPIQTRTAHRMCHLMSSCITGNRNHQPAEFLFVFLAVLCCTVNHSRLTCDLTLCYSPTGQASSNVSLSHLCQSQTGNRLKARDTPLTSADTTGRSNHRSGS